MRPKFNEQFHAFLSKKGLSKDIISSITNKMTTLNDIINSDLTKNKIFYLKVKRSMSNKSYFDRRYIKFINSLSSIDNLIILPPELSAFRLAKFCDAAISLPFTSTSHIFTHENKKSIYYDPLQFFDKKHLASRGIEIMYKEDLKKFLLEI